MAIKKKSNGLLTSNTKTALLLIVIGIILMYVSTINFCGTCTGWDVINPFCRAGYVACMATMAPIHLIMRIIAGITVLVGGYKLIKGIIENIR